MSCKQTIRREMIEKRKAFQSGNGKDFTKKIQSLEIYKEAKTVMLYMPIRGESDVTELIDNTKTFLTPVTKGDEMYAAVVGEMEKGDFSVLVPKDKTAFDKFKIDVVIVPGVAFDKKFNRMGYGKGYYDKFLKDINALKIGVCHSFQLLDEMPSEEHDVKMDIIVTEKDIWRRESIL